MCTPKSLVTEEGFTSFPSNITGGKVDILLVSCDIGFLAYLTHLVYKLLNFSLSKQSLKASVADNCCRLYIKSQDPFLFSLSSQIASSF